MPRPFPYKSMLGQATYVALLSFVFCSLGILNGCSLGSGVDIPSGSAPPEFPIGGENDPDDGIDVGDGDGTEAVGGSAGDPNLLGGAAGASDEEGQHCSGGSAVATGVTCK